MVENKDPRISPLGRLPTSYWDRDEVLKLKLSPQESSQEKVKRVEVQKNSQVSTSK